jgi:TolB-like protein/class 3 adenylate cyclase/Flp pilus assembly protein TadD
MSGDRVERRLAAIMAADVAGYSRLIGADEGGTLRALKAIRAELIDPKIAEHRGRLVKTTGDGLLVEFGSVVDALRCATEVQRAMAERNFRVMPDERIEFRIGINMGDIVVEDGDIFGDGVNVAARLEGLAEPGGVCVSARVQEDAAGRLDLAFEDIGEQALRNIARPVRAYRVAMGGCLEVAKEPAPLPLPDKPSIAVLPFANLSDDPEQEFFADGIAEDIITALSKLRWFFVIARNSTFTYKGRAVDVKQIGRELGVRYVLEGSVRKAGTRLRITAQLVEATSGNHVWAERWDREIGDIFAVQDDITERVAAAIEPQLYAAEHFRSQRKPPESLDAWECVVRALSYISRRSQEDNAAAVELLQRAVTLDPGYAQAHSVLAYVLGLDAVYGWSPREKALPPALEEAQKAVLLDDDDPWSHVALGSVLARIDRPEEAISEFRRALALNPSFALAHSRLAMALCNLGESEEALAEIDTAERLNPRELWRGLNNLARAIAHFIGGRYHEGIEFAQNAILEGPGRIHSHRMLVVNLALAGRIDDARAALAVLKKLQPDFSLEWVENYRREEDRRRWIEGFRLAGSE